MKVLRLMSAAVMALLTGGLLSAVSGVPIELTVPCLVVLSMIPTPQGVLSVKLTKEIWLADLLETFYPDSSFLKKADDWSSWVENDKINFAETGSEPNVLINNSTYLIPVVDRGDTPRSVELEEYQSEGTVLHAADLVELAYAKRQSVVKQHKDSIYNRFAIRAAYNYAPVSDATFTPVLETSGDSNGTHKRLSFADILALKSRFDNIEAPDNRVLVLNPNHYNDLALEDLAMLRGVLSSGNNLFGFSLMTYSKTPVFSTATGAKIGYGGTSVGADDTISSIAFVASEVMRAVSSFDMFELLRSPEYAGDVVNFRMRGLAMSKRNKYIGAIYSDLAA